MKRHKNAIIKIVLLQIILICWPGTQIHAQTANVAFRNLTSAEGLPSSAVTDIAQDSFGFIWIATWHGDYRYDGHLFKKISGTEDGRYVMADKKGGVWISFEYSAGYFDPHTDSLRNYKIPTKHRFPEITIDNAGMVWVATSNGILKYDQRTDHFVKEKGQRPGSIYSLNAWGNGELLFMYVDSAQALIGRRTAKGSYSYEPFPQDQNNPEKGKPFFYQEKGRSNSDVRSVFVRKIDTTRILIIDRFGWAFKSLKAGNWIFKKPLNANLPLLASDIKLDNNGNFWLNQQDVVSRINIATGMVTSYKNDQRNPNSVLTLSSVFFDSHIFIDRQGVLWIASYSRGISRLNLYENDFGLLRDSAGEPSKDILSALESKDGSYWIGSRTEDHGLVHYAADGKIIRKYSAPFDSPPGKTTGSNLSHPFAWSLAQSGDGSIWVGTGSPGAGRGGLNRIRPGTGQITRFKHDPKDPSSLIGDWIDKICADGSDRVWMSTSAGLCYIDPVTEKITRGIGRQNADTANNNPYSLEMVTSAGDIVISRSPSGQTYIIDHKTLEKRPFGINATLQEDLQYVYQDSAGNVFFYSKKRFGYLDPSFKKIAYAYNYKEKSFPADQVVAINSDKEGKIWLATDNGIVKFDPATEKSTDFGFERGLQGNDFFELMDYRSPSGKIYSNGTGGINIFDPESIKSNPFPPQMVFTGVKLNGKQIAYSKASAIQQPIYAANTITVAPDVLTISVDFSAIHFADFGANRYQYRLEGFDKAWQDGGWIGNANYTNLSPGKYTLYIKGSNLDDVWSDGKKSITIIILPPWWQTWWAYVLYALIIVLLLWRLYKYQKTRTIRAEREKTRQRELAQAKEIEKAYHELKTTQAQLIQSEKMASLGELTAGIAHEIQNPLNFVNNFSDVNREMLEELKAESEKPKAEQDEQMELELINDLINNEAKINHHGKRADAIVKGMLQHSRATSGKKEPTSLNALANEYLRLAYHGFRAKDKDFNANLVTNFDDKLPMINMVPQDIGRAILNIINNAFYAIQQKAKTAGPVYKPTIEVTTFHLPLQGLGGLKVRDNGNGIPDAIKDKIMQPFFTTKPTGDGTGLGLSLSYDIVVKGHGGKITVESNEGEGSEFIIQIPIEKVS